MVGVSEKKIPEGYVSDHFARSAEVWPNAERDHEKYYKNGEEAQE